jgi:hypothetical protein
MNLWGGYDTISKSYRILSAQQNIPDKIKQDLDYLKRRKQDSKILQNLTTKFFSTAYN